MLMAPYNNRVSFLRSHSVDRLHSICRKTPQTSLAYFYCRYIDNCSAGELLATFLRHLIEDHEEVYPLVRTVYDEHKQRQIQLTNLTAIELLEDIVPLFKRIYMIVDGFDEVPEIEKMSVLEFLKRLPTHLLIFLRPMEAYSGILPSVTSLSIQARNGDIEACVLGKIRSSHRLRKLLQDDQAAIHKIIAKIQLKSCGM